MKFKVIRTSCLDLKRAAIVPTDSIQSEMQPPQWSHSILHECYYIGATIQPFVLFTTGTKQILHWILYWNCINTQSLSK